MFLLYKIHKLQCSFQQRQLFGCNLLEVTVTSKYWSHALALWGCVGDGSESAIKTHPRQALLPLQSPPLGIVPHTLVLFLFPTLSAWVLTTKCLVLVFLQNGLAGSSFPLSSFFHIRLSSITIKLYRNKKTKLKLVAFSSNVNQMEINTENKVLEGEKEKYGGSGAVPAYNRGSGWSEGEFHCWRGYSGPLLPGQYLLSTSTSSEDTEGQNHPEAV